jgi:hypothetical protein
MDRDYLHFHRLGRVADAGPSVVIRERPDVTCYLAASRPVDRTANLR